MDPVSLIIAAIVTGVSSGLGDSVKNDVERAYQVLRDRLIQRFSNSSWVRRSLERVEKVPNEENQGELREALKSAGELRKDDELLELAEGVSQAGKFTVEQMMNAAHSATIRNTEQSLTNADSSDPANIKQEITAGDGAVIEGGGQRISFADRPGKRSE